MKLNNIFKAICLTLSLICACTCSANNNGQQELSECILDKDSNPQPMLLKLLQELKIEHDGSLQDIVTQTQKVLLRTPGSERWHMREQYEDRKATLSKIFRALGCIDAIQPTKNYYDYAVLLGSTANSMRDRFAYMLQCWHQGTRFGKLVFLVSERPLDPQQEPLPGVIDPTAHETLPYKQDWQKLSSVPKTEHDMMRLIYSQTNLPQDFAQLPTTFINTPMQPMSNGMVRRANTGDTLQAWLATQPAQGSCCVISDQPYVGYQDSVVRTFLPKGFAINTVGMADDGQTKVAVFLDTLARWLYQENQRRQQDKLLS